MVERAVVIVTGASRGLGAATAQILGRLGAQVVLTARSTRLLEQEARQMAASGGSALTVPGDVSKEADCREIVQRALDRFGRIDSLVHNAGVVEPIEPVAELDPEEWQQNWKVNLLGPAMLTQMALPELRKRKGRVIFITSGSAENVVGGWGAYSTAKAAANHLVRILAREEPEITTLALRPGIVDTQMQATIRDKGKSHMAEENYKWLYGLYEQGKLLPPDQPGLATACLALYAPQDWSGEILQWDERRVRELVKAHDEPGAYPE